MKNLRCHFYDKNTCKYKDGSLKATHSASRHKMHVSKH